MKARNFLPSGLGGKWSGWAIFKRFFKSHLRFETEIHPCKDSIDPHCDIRQKSTRILPSPLIDCEQSGAFVLGIIRDYDTHKQRQADHATEENINVYVDCVNLKKKHDEILKDYVIQKKLYSRTAKYTIFTVRWLICNVKMSKR